jgi:hypothetical protein
MLGKSLLQVGVDVNRADFLNNLRSSPTTTSGSAGHAKDTASPAGSAAFITRRFRR